MEARRWNVYLSGEIHSDWRSVIESSCAELGVPVRLMGPQTDHARSDGAGDVLGDENKAFWRDHKSAKVNAIRTRGLLRNCDIVVVRFGEKYRQWNAAFDAGMAMAWGKSIITLHDEALDHALKEIDAAALATARRPDQVVSILQYVTAQPF